MRVPHGVSLFLVSASVAREKIEGDSGTIVLRVRRIHHLSRSDGEADARPDAAPIAAALAPRLALPAALGGLGKLAGKDVDAAYMKEVCAATGLRELAPGRHCRAARRRP